MRLRYGIVLAGAFAVSAGACASASGGTNGAAVTPSGELLAEGERPRTNAQTQAAERELGLAVLAGSPEEARPRYEAALAAAEEAIAQDERNPLPWYQAGTALIGLEQYERADSALSRAEELRPVYRLETSAIREEAWIDLYQQAAPFVNEARYEEAIPFYEAANVIYDERPEIMYTLGQIYLQMGQNDRAIENFRRSLQVIRSDAAQQMDSATVASWEELALEAPPMIAQALIQAERYQEAVAELRPLVEANPDNQAYARSLANIYVEIDQPDSARAVYDRLVASGGLTATDYAEIGYGYYNMRDWSGAAEAFEAAVTVAPRDRDAVEWWVRALQIDLSEKEDAGTAVDPAEIRELVDAAERWLELDPNSHTAHLILAQTLNKAGDEARTLQLIEQIESLPFTVENLELRRERDGGGTVVGEVRNISLEPGQTLTLQFTFFGSSGTALGTQTARVSLPAPEASQVFNVEFTSPQAVEGYSYTVQVM